MTGTPHSARFGGFARAEDGAAMVEFSIVCVVFFLIMFALIDFGRLGFAHVSGETALRIAVRTAAVRPAACTGVPDRIMTRGTVPSGTIPPRFGSSCNLASYACQTVATVSCRGSSTNPTAQEVWARVAPLLPAGTTEESLQYTYTQDKQLGYLGGPYVPVLTVELIDRAKSGTQPLTFLFFSPFTAAFNPLSLPRFSSSLPAEDLAQGEAG
jgi:Flp pilus assembly protein TadG